MGGLARPINSRVSQKEGLQNFEQNFEQSFEQNFEQNRNVRSHLEQLSRIAN